MFLPAGVPDQEPLEAFDDVRPVEGLHRSPRPSPHRCDERRLAREPDRRRDEALPVALPDRQPAHAALDVHARRRVVIRDHEKPARHRLQGDVAERLGLAGEQEDVGRGVVRGEVVARLESGEDQIGMVAPQRRAEGPVTHEHEPKSPAHPAHCPVCLDRKLDVLLGGEASDVQHHEVVTRHAPRFAQGEGPARRVEAAAVDTAADHAEVPEARSHELGLQAFGRDERSRAGVVEIAEVAGRRVPQPAGAIVTDIGVEVRVKSAVDGYAEGGPRAQRRPAERSFRRGVHGIGTVARPGRAQRRAGRQSDLQAAIAG